MAVKTTTSDTETIKCPECGEPQCDLWELFIGANSEAEIECDGCGATLTIERNVSIDYTCTVDAPPKSDAG